MTEKDEVNDKLFHDESSSSLKDQVEVKFVSPDNAINGDAKINIGDLKASFAGMGKEELMKFANDPFWIKLRWFLFIGFWLVWLGMLFGAIAIILYAPKCLKFYEQSPLYEVDAKNIDLKGLSLKVDYLKSLGVKQISLSNVLKSAENQEGIIDFKDIDPSYGTIENFKDLVNKLKTADIHLLLSFSPDYASIHHEFFNKSLSRQAPYTDYFVWVPAKGYSSDMEPLPPNNWLSKEGGSAWKWNAIRKEFYLHQFGVNEPDFNFNNPAVVQYFSDVLDFWLKLGVSGFNLQDIEYLLEDSELKNETIGNKYPGATFDQYDFYNHQHTALVPGIAKILNTWGETVQKYTGRILIVGDSLTESSSYVNLVAHKLEISSKLSAEQLKNITDHWVKQKNLATWQWSCSDGSLKCISPPLLSVLNVVSFLLPGTPISRSGEELGLINSALMPWKDQPNEDSSVNLPLQLEDPFSFYSIYKQLIELRNQPSVQYGSYNSTVYNHTAFVFTRIKSGNPNILVAVNLDQDQTINLDLGHQLKSIPDDLNILLTTKRISDIFIPNKTISSDNIKLPPYTGAVFSYEPKQEV